MKRSYQHADAVTLLSVVTMPTPTGSRAENAQSEAETGPGSHTSRTPSQEATA
jgi:hypothetical protein